MAPHRTAVMSPLERYATSLEPVLRAVAAAAGPDGRTCLIETDGEVAPAATALAIVRSLADARGADRLLVRVLRELLFEADRDLGDGTARLALLWGGIIAEGARVLATGISPDRLAADVARLGSRLSDNLAEATEAADRKTLASVAASAGATPKIAQLIADMVTRVGPDGAAEIVESSRPGLHIEISEGFLFEATPASDLFARVDLDPAFILVADERLEDLGPLVPLLEGFATHGKALVVVAREIAGPALHVLVRNHKENGLRAVALRPSAVSQVASELLEDLAVVTGATLVADRFGTQMSSLRPGMLGRCARLTLAGGLATFLDAAGTPEAVADRRRLLSAQAERQKYLALDRERLLLRAARLHGLSARLHVGTGGERGSAMQVVATRRALASARAAAESGTVPGGGIAFVRSFDNLPEYQASDADVIGAAAHQVLAAGVSALMRGLSGHEAAQGPSSGRPGTLARTLGLGDAAESVVRDPLRMTRSILDRALSGAIPLLQCGAVVHE